MARSVARSSGLQGCRRQGIAAAAEPHSMHMTAPATVRATKHVVPNSMNPLERRATAGLAAIYGLRMLGLFMVLPVFALYAEALPGAPAAWQIGLAIGIYGLTQAMLQLPLGMASDRLGRKPIIAAGMLVFAAGSLLAGLAESIEWIIAGRALQGAGAIAAAVTALLADLTREAQRTKAMAILGAGMGATFTLALVLGPVVAGWIGVSGIFLLTGALAVASLPVIFFVVPNADQPVLRGGSLRLVLADSQLLRLDAGIFLLHALLTALFVAAPLALRDTLGLGGASHWRVYLPVLLVSLLLIFPLIRWAESQQRLRACFAGAVVLLGISAALAAWGHADVVWLLLALTLFFIAFNYLEGTLPSLISRMAPADQKGAALGVYSTAQFLGAFAGGILGGWGLELAGVTGVFAASALLALVWLTFALGLRPPQSAGPEEEDLEWRAASTK